MKRAAFAVLAVTAALLAQAAPPASHLFGVIGHAAGSGGEAGLSQALSEAGDKEMSFVVVNGIKAKSEPCSDSLYLARRELLGEAGTAIVAVPAASDWSDCRNSAGRTASIERLNRLRELLFAEPATLGARKLPLVRQSSNPKFRSYAENSHWMVGSVLYATLNLPANNNNYRHEAGRNSEFEDRLVANRFWLNRLFAHAARSKATAVVLFSEGDIRAQSYETGLRALLTRANLQDGYVEARKQVNVLASKFEGKVLLVDAGQLAPGAEPAIQWRANLGHLSVGSKSVDVKVISGGDTVFALRGAGN